MTDLFAAAVNGGPMREVDFMTKNLNIWVASQYNWIGDDIFMECKGDYNLKDQQDRQVMCWGGMDLGQTSDMTCFAQLFDPDQNDGKYIFLLHTWLCEETYRKRIEQGEPHAQWVRDGELEITPGNTTDYGYLEQRIIDIQRNYNLVNVGYDVANSSRPLSSWKMKV
jgi:phage terminase large subunit-like protein